MEYTAVVGVDWGKKEHAYVVQGAVGAKGVSKTSTAPEAIHEWVGSIRKQYPSGKILFAIEEGQKSLLYALLIYDFIEVLAINPRASQAYRESLRLSGASDDVSDAHLLCEFASKHGDRLRVWRPDSPITRTIRTLCEHRRDLVDERTASAHRMRAALEMFFPQALQWFGNETEPLLWAFLTRWPTLDAFRQAKGQQITELLRSKRCRKAAARAEDLIEKVRSSVGLVQDQTLISTYSRYVSAQIALLNTFDEQIAAYDAAIAQAWAEHPDREIFDSLPGAGPVMAPRLAAAFGTDRDRYEQAADMQCYSGIAPVIEQSGKMRLVHARWLFPTFLHQTFHEFAQYSITISPWAHAVYKAQRDRGAKHHEAIRSLAFRWIRIVFRLWKNSTTYDEQTHVGNLIERQSPIALKISA